MRTYACFTTCTPGISSPSRSPSEQPPRQALSASHHESQGGNSGAVYVAVLAINLDVTIVNVALPSIATELDADTRGL
jgi:hypothetical protein